MESGKNAFSAPARIGSQTTFNNTHTTPGPSSFTGETGTDNSIGLTFPYIAVPFYSVPPCPPPPSPCSPYFKTGWNKNDTINMALVIYPLYSFLVNTLNYPQSSVIGSVSGSVPNVTPLEPGDGPPQSI